TPAIALEGRLQLRFLCKDKPLAKLPWRLVDGKNELKGTTDDKGGLEAVIQQEFKVAHLFLGEAAKPVLALALVPGGEEHEKSHALRARARLRNLRLYPPHRVSLIEDEREPGRQYPNALALGM